MVGKPSSEWEEVLDRVSLISFADLVSYDQSSTSQGQDNARQSINEDDRLVK